LIDSIIDSSFA